MVKFPQNYDWKALELLKVEIATPVESPIRVGGRQFTQGRQPGSFFGQVLGNNPAGFGGTRVPTSPVTPGAPHDPQGRGLAGGTGPSGLFNTDSVDPQSQPRSQSRSDKQHLRRVWLEQQKNLQAYHKDNPNATLGEAWGVHEGQPVARFLRKPNAAFEVLDREKGAIPIGNEAGSSGPMFAGGLSSLGMKGRFGDALNSFSSFLSPTDRRRKAVDRQEADYVSRLRQQYNRRKAINPNYKLPFKDQERLDRHNLEEAKTRAMQDPEYNKRMMAALEKTPAYRELVRQINNKTKADADAAHEADAITTVEGVDEEKRIADELAAAGGAGEVESSNVVQDPNVMSPEEAERQTRLNLFNTERKKLDNEFHGSGRDNLLAGLMNQGKTPEQAEAAMDLLYQANLKRLAEEHRQDLDADNSEIGEIDTGAGAKFDAGEIKGLGDSDWYKDHSKRNYIKNFADAIGDPARQESEGIKAFRQTPHENLQAQGLESVIREGLGALGMKGRGQINNAMKLINPAHQGSRPQGMVHSPEALTTALESILGADHPLANLAAWANNTTPVGIGDAEEGGASVADTDLDDDSEVEQVRSENLEGLENELYGGDVEKPPEKVERSYDTPMDLAWAVLKGI